MTEINNKKLCESCFSEISGEGACPRCGFNGAEFTPDPMVLPMGTMLNDKIVIGRVMGKGGFGITYLGYDLRMDRTIAVKEYYPNGISYRAPGGTEVVVADAKSAETFDSGAEKFYTEAEMVSQFNGNPNIVSVFDYFRANSTVYLLMEYLSGITLKNYVKKHGKLTDGQALYVMDKIVAALSITHSAGVLHRDISPDNIMICGDGKVKLIDFGAAREVLNEGSSNLTVVMKPGYTPIEQYTKKGKQGAWTDIYSLGVSMYYALTKVIIDDPYARMDSDEEFDENKYKINDSLWTILRKCTMINASDRYGSAIDLRKALRSVSAPLIAEAIELSPDDLKEEPEEPNAPEAATEGDFPVTAAMTSGGSVEIERFETTMPDEPAAPDLSDLIGKSEKPGQSDKNSKSVEKTSKTPAETENSAETETPAPPPKKKRMIAAICSAAAVVAVIVICVVAGLSKQKAPDVISDPSGSSTSSASDGASSDGASSGGASSTSSGGASSSSEDDDIIYSAFYPRMVDGKLFFEMDSGLPYNGWGKEISKDNLLRFDGDVKVTLGIEHVTAAYDGDSITIEDRNGNHVNVTAFNTGINVGESMDERCYWIFSGQDSFSFVIDRGTIESMSGGLKFIVWNLFVKTAVLEAFDPAELEACDDAVKVKINSYVHDDLSNFIPLEVLQSFDSDVRIILDIEYSAMESAIERVNSYIVPITETWQELEVEVDNISSVPWVTDRRHFYSLGCKNLPEKFIFTLPQSEIEKLGANGLCFNATNLYIKTATVEGVNKTVVEIDTEYPGTYGPSNSILKTDLEAFGCDVMVTLDLESFTDMPDPYNNCGAELGVVDNYTDPVPVNAFNLTVDGAGMYVLGDGAKKFVFAITEENIAAIGGGKLYFKCLNTIVRRATIEKYRPEEREPSDDAKIVELNSSYPGDWQGSELIPRDVLEEFGGDIRITLYIESALGESSDPNLEMWINPVMVNEDWSWRQISERAIGDNLYRNPDAPYYIGLNEQSVPKTVTFVLPWSEVAESDRGLIIQTACLYVRKAALERA